MGLSVTVHHTPLTVQNTKTVTITHTNKTEHTKKQCYRDGYTYHIHYHAKVWGQWDFLNVFERYLFRLPRLYLFNQKCEKYRKTVKYYYFFIWIYFKMYFFPVITKLNFQQPLVFSVTWFFRNHNDTVCWFGFQETFLIIINVEICCVLISVETMTHFSGLFEEHKVLKNIIYLKKEIFCNNEKYFVSPKHPHHLQYVQTIY